MILPCRYLRIPQRMCSVTMQSPTHIVILEYLRPEKVRGSGKGRARYASRALKGLSSWSEALEALSCFLSCFQCVSIMCNNDILYRIIINDCILLPHWKHPGHCDVQKPLHLREDPRSFSVPNYARSDIKLDIHSSSPGDPF